MKVEMKLNQFFISEILQFSRLNDTRLLLIYQVEIYINLYQLIRERQVGK
jgi:hypothetical protein